MKNIWIFFGVLISFNVAEAQYDNYSYGNQSYNNNGEDRYFYDDNFDWRWDIRVRISDGLNNGRITNFEANNLYNRLERIERLEYSYQSDGFFSDFEQNEIWNEVKWLNRQIGIDLRDFDRTYYGYAYIGGFRGYNPFYFGRSYDFYRFDKRGYGNLRLGYTSRNYFPTNHYYSRNYAFRNYKGNNYNNNRNYKTYRNNDSKNNSNRSYGPRGEDRDTKSREWNNRSNGNSNSNGKSNDFGNRPSSNGRLDAGRDNSIRDNIQTPRAPETRSSERGNSSSSGRESFERKPLPDRSKAQGKSRGSNGVE